MFKGRVALVTGSGQGIGRDIALRLAKGGATLIINYVGPAEGANEVVDIIKSEGGEAMAYECNVADLTAVDKMISDIVLKYGKLDILVNNAGITKDNLLLKMSEADFDAVINVNLKGTFNTTKAVTKLMMKQRYGRIINISSIVGVIGNAGQANYCASKAGIIGLTKAVARELASRNVTANAVAPGFIDTDMTKILPDEVKKTLLSQIPAGKLGSVSDISNAVEFLAKEESGYITGQVININGGMAMQ